MNNSNVDILHFCSGNQQRNSISAKRYGEVKLENGYLEHTRSCMLSYLVKVGLIHIRRTSRAVTLCDR
jgi:hypothetical protein